MEGSAHWNGYISEVADNRRGVYWRKRVLEEECTGKRVVEGECTGGGVYWRGSVLEEACTGGGVYWMGV